MSKSGLALFITACTFVYIAFNLSKWEDKQMLHWDETGYYIYMPAVVVYHDLADLTFFSKMEDKYWLNTGVKGYCIYDSPTGHKVEKYAIGTALFELPFYLIAHWYSLHHPDDFPPDGYSEAYMCSVVFSYIFWVIAGLFFLRRFLLVYFTDAAVAITLLMLAFGTNLYFYTVFEPGMSHPFSFSLFCFFLYATERWYRTEQKVYGVLLGLILGLITITRPINILVMMLPLCWQYKDGGISGKIAFFKRQVFTLILSFVAFVLVVMIQAGYWKYVSGSWIYYSYQNEHFNFLAPHVWDGLFSYRKGWFVYTPVALVALVGMVALVKFYKQIAINILIYLSVMIYVVFCWWDWSYGGGFGSRALIEVMAVVSIPLAMLVQWVFSRRKLALNVLLFIVFAFFIALNTFQSYQLKENIIVWDNTTKAFYWRMFGKLKITDEDRKMLEQN